MMAATVWLLIAIGGSNSSPSTLAALNDVNECRSAAASLQTQAKERTGSPYIYVYCIPVSAKAIVK